MLRTVLGGKIHRATVTQADLHYVGSITIDEDLTRAAGLVEGEKVQVVDITNGSRIETYVIVGEPGSGQDRASTAPPPISSTRGTRSSSCPICSHRMPSWRTTLPGWSMWTMTTRIDPARHGSGGAGSRRRQSGEQPRGRPRMTTQPRSAASGEVTDPEPLVLDGVVPYPRDLAALYREKGHWIGRTHAEMLFDTVSRHPDGTAVIFGEERLSYAELGDQVLRLAAGLRARGIRRGDRVVVHLPNIPIYLGLVFAPVRTRCDPRLRPGRAPAQRDRVLPRIRRGEGRTSRSIARAGTTSALLAAELRQSIPRLEQAIVVSGDGGSSADTDELLSHAPLDHRRRSLPGDIAFLQLSGGTTGRPKMIPRTHDDYLTPCVRATASAASIGAPCAWCPCRSRTTSR